MSDVCKNNYPTVRKLAICVFKIEAKANLFWDKSAGRRHGFFGIGATQSTAVFDGVWVDGKTSGRVQSREAENGRRLLWFYTSEAEEEIRGVSFVNHQSTGNLWRRVGRRPPRVAARVLGNKDQALGFCKSEAKEEICSVSFTNGLRKTNRSQEEEHQQRKQRGKEERERRKNNAMKIVGNMRLYALIRILTHLFTYFHLYVFAKNTLLKQHFQNSCISCYILTLISLFCAIGFFWHVSCIRIKTGGDGRNLNRRWSFPI